MQKTTEKGDVGLRRGFKPSGCPKRKKLLFFISANEFMEVNHFANVFFLKTVIKKLGWMYVQEHQPGFKCILSDNRMSNHRTC